MLNFKFQKAIEKLSLDNGYYETVAADPDKLKRDFELNDEEMGALKAGDLPGSSGYSLRPIGICCTCYAPVPIQANQT